MSNGLNKLSLRQDAKSMSARLSELTSNVEQLTNNIGQFVVGVNQEFGKIAQRLAQLEEAVEAVVHLQGSAEVQIAMHEKRAERAEATAATEKAALEAGVADGYLTVEATVSEKSVIVGRYLNKDGVVMAPGRVQLIMPKVQPQFASQLMEQAVGHTLDLPGNEKFELLEIYALDEAKAREVVASQQAAAAATAAVKDANATATVDEKTDEEATPADVTAVG